MPRSAPWPFTRNRDRDKAPAEHRPPDRLFPQRAAYPPAKILSPATRRFDLTEKRELYRRNAVAHLWLVDPDARTLEAFTLIAGAWTLAAACPDGDDIRAAPFEALAFPLKALWPD